MNKAIGLLEIGAKRLSTEKDFMSFILYRYMEIESISDSDLIEGLNCSAENFYRLALCKAPNVTAGDFVERLERICAYSKTTMVDINRIIKRVDAISKLSSVESQNSYLMAARDKGKKAEE
jgi:hypothetical protein